MIFRSSVIAVCWTLVAVHCSFADDTDIDVESLKVRDELRLKSGVILKGTLIKESVSDGKKTVTFETENGDVLTIKLSQLVEGKGVRTVDEAGKRYNDHLDKLVDTAQFHHDLVTWCLEQDGGSTVFKDQIRFHRHRIMELDPNDEKVRQQLGYRYISAIGKWVREEQYWNSIGYVQDDAAWVSTLQRRQNKAIKSARKSPPGSLAKFRTWQRKQKRMSLQQAQVELLSFTDPALLSKLYDEIQREKNPRLRAIYTEAFGKFPHPVSVRGLVAMFMDDQSDRALDLLKQEGFDRNAATVQLAAFLNPNDTSYEANARINRAAFGIGELKTTGAILRLADVLMTVHVIKPAGNPGRMNIGFGNNGVNGMQMGGNGKATKARASNKSVLKALRDITEQNFGYDKTDWQRWYLENYTHRDLKARR